MLKVRWPAFDAELAAEDELEYPVQVNGKLRARIHVAASAGEEEVRTKALADEKVIQHLAGLQSEENHCRAAEAGEHRREVAGRESAYAHFRAGK